MTVQRHSARHRYDRPAKEMPYCFQYAKGIIKLYGEGGLISEPPHSNSVIAFLPFQGVKKLITD